MAGTLTGEPDQPMVRTSELTARGKRMNIAKWSVAVLVLAFASNAVAADATIKSLVTQAKTSGLVRVFDSHLGETSGRLTDTSGDVFCLQASTSNPEKPVQYCFAYSAVEMVVKPGTGAHHDFVGIWMRGARAAR